MYQIIYHSFVSTKVQFETIIVAYGLRTVRFRSNTHALRYTLVSTLGVHKPSHSLHVTDDSLYFPNLLSYASVEFHVISKQLWYIPSHFLYVQNYFLYRLKQLISVSDPLLYRRYTFLHISYRLLRWVSEYYPEVRSEQNMTKRNVSRIMPNWDKLFQYGKEKYYDRTIFNKVLFTIYNRRVSRYLPEATPRRDLSQAANLSAAVD